MDINYQQDHSHLTLMNSLMDSSQAQHHHLFQGYKPHDRHGDHSMEINIPADNNGSSLDLSRKVNSSTCNDNIATASEGISSSHVVEEDNKSGSNKKRSSSSTSSRSEKMKNRKPRYAFQTRSQVDILDDGYRWRKYGQKAVKNNTFPRSYYRCTHQGCNVKKQVQRLSRDEGIVVTTYEGIHSHAIEKNTDNFEHILSQMQIYTPFEI